MASTDLEKSEKTSIQYQHSTSSAESPDDFDAQFGGTEARKALEKKLLRKIDLRMSILIVIYILNYVRR